jgi:hypothetical protein
MPYIPSGLLLSGTGCVVLKSNKSHRRNMGESQRVNALLGQVEGRLTYKALIA